MSQDRDSLFAALALRLGLVRPDRLAAAWGQWQGSSRPLADFLVDHGALSAADRASIEQRLDQLQAEHAGDSPSIWGQVSDERVRSILESLPSSRFEATLDIPSASRIDRQTAEMTTGHDSSPALDPSLTVDSTPGVGGFSKSGYEAVGPIEGSVETPTVRYTRSRLHAQGGVGQIWLARDASLGREVALKELRPEQSGNLIVRERFVDEARITGQLEHPGIVPIYELARHDDDHRPYYTMRFVRGRTLSRATREFHDRKKAGRSGDLEFRALLDAFISVCNAVGYAHTRGVVHRDLKGQNIMLGDFGEVLVLDWGLAKAVSPEAEAPSASEASPGSWTGATPSSTQSRSTTSGSTLPTTRLASSGNDQDLGTIDGIESLRDATLEGQVLGTPAYMPPEQAEGLVDRIGPWSDIYSLGAILYEILTGTWPSGGKTTRELLDRVKKGHLIPPHQVDPRVPRALEAICMRAMKFAPRDRYASAVELADDVRRWLADEPISVYRDPFAARAGRWARRHRSLVLSSAAVLAVGLPTLLGANVLISRQRDRAQALEGVARGAVNDFYVEVADTWLEDASDPRQEQYLERALAFYGVGANPVADPDPVETDRAPDDLEPGRKQAVEGALTYFEKLSDDLSGPSARLDLARTLLRIGDLRRKLGRSELADRAYAQGIARLEPIAGDQPAAARELGRLRTRLGALDASLGRSEEAEAALRKSIEELTTVESRLAEPSSTRLDLANAEVELADLLKVRGRNDDAEKAYRSAIGRLEAIVQGRPDDPEATRQLAAACDGLAVVLMLQLRSDEAEPLLRRSLALLEPLREKFPTVARYRENLAKTTNSLGYVLRRLGQATEAERTFASALEQYSRLASDFPGRIELLRARARAQSNLATALDDSGKLREAEPVSREAARLYEELAAKAPDLPKIRRDLSLARTSLGSILARRSRFEDANTAYQRAAEVARQLVATHPKVPDYQSALGAALLNRGVLAWQTGTPAEAEALLTESGQIFQELSAEHPERPDYVERLGVGLNHLGLSLTDLDRKADAETAFRRGLALYDALLAKDGASVPARSGLAEILANLATNGPTDTDALQTRALEISEKLAAERPQDRALQRNLAMVRYNRGDWLLQNGKPDDARPLLTQSAEGFDSLGAPAGVPGRTTDPEPHLLAATAYGRLGELDLVDHPADATISFERAFAHARDAVVAVDGRGYLDTLSKAGDQLVSALVSQARYEDASHAALEIASAAPGQAAPRVDAARLLARCIPPVSSDPALDASTRESRSRLLADRAVAQLRVAVDSGYRSADLASVPDFTPLAGREDFKSLASSAASPPASE